MARRAGALHSRAYYRKINRYKYQLLEDYMIKTGYRLKEDVHTLYNWLILTKDGTLFIKKGYCWDGPSGPTFDTNNFMLGSLVHDAFYQLIRENKLPKNSRLFADKLLYKLCVDDGMTKIRAWFVYYAVRFFGRRAAKRRSIPPSIYTP